MTEVALKRAVPNERWHMVLEFDDGSFRLLDVGSVRRDKGWEKLAYPQHAKRFLLAPDAITWPAGGAVDIPYLLRHSTPIAPAALEYEYLRLCYKNQAPTPEDTRHHVYEVEIGRFSSKPFRLAESIGGGHAERGGSRACTFAELLDLPWWRRHFELAGCGWAIAPLETLQYEPERLPDVLDRLVAEACRTNGLPVVG
jgi:hypothetical protein